MMRSICLLLCAFIAIAIGGVLGSDVKFYLSNDKYQLKELTIGQHDLVGFDKENEVKIFCHGWVDSVTSYWFLSIKAEYLKKGLTNIIGVDWSSQAKGVYAASVDNIDDVGHSIALFIADLHDGYEIPWSKFHLICHSLGSHVCGYAGQYIISLRHEIIGRITGLDPAGPRFEGVAPNMRLSFEDALFVDVIHTDAGVLGYKAPIGHVDFYPNGGTAWQVGCGLFDISCSHLRSPRYFIESINSLKFVAVSCLNYEEFVRGNCTSNGEVIMGENVDRNARGSLFLNTSDSPPFALG